MPQATRLTRSNDFSQDELNNVTGRSTVRTAALDAELDAIKATTDQVIDNQGLVQRDDGKLVNESVHADALSAAVVGLINGNWTPRGAWLTVTAYALYDMVSESNDAYVCLEAHTSGVFATDLAANKWFRIGQLSYAELASTENGKGASLIGVGDTKGRFVKKDVESVLNYLASRLPARAAHVPLLAQTLGMPLFTGRATSVIVGTNSYNVTFDGTHIWVTNYASNNVSKIDIATDTVVATVAVGTGPVGIAFDGNHMWVVNGSTNDVSKIDIATDTVVATVAVGTFPEGIAFDGNHMWVVNYTTNDVSKIDIATNTVVATVAVGTDPFGIAFDGTHIWVTNYTSNNVSKIDIATDTVVATVTVGTGPEGGIAFDGAHMWIANSSTNNVSKIDIATDTVVATLAVGTLPIAIAFDGTHIWVTNSTSQNISKIDITRDTVESTITTGVAMRGIAFDGSHMWVCNRNSNKVSKILAK